MFLSLCFSLPFSLKINKQPWLVWFSGLNAGLQTAGSLVRFLVKAHAWVVGQIPSLGCARGNHTLMFLSLSFSFILSLKRNKSLLKKLINKVFKKKNK